MSRTTRHVPSHRYLRHPHTAQELRAHIHALADAREFGLRPTALVRLARASVPTLYDDKPVAAHSEVPFVSSR